MSASTAKRKATIVAKLMGCHLLRAPKLSRDSPSNDAIFGWWWT